MNKDVPHDRQFILEVRLTDPEIREYKKNRELYYFLKNEFDDNKTLQILMVRLSYPASMLEQAMIDNFECRYNSKACVYIYILLLYLL